MKKLFIVTILDNFWNEQITSEFSSGNATIATNKAKRYFAKCLGCSQTEIKILKVGACK